MRNAFIKTWESIKGILPADVIKNAHNGTGYFDGIHNFKENGWFKGVDDNGRKLFFFRNKRQYLCIHERYSNRNDIIVTTGNYFHSTMDDSALEAVNEFYENNGSWGPKLGCYLEDFWGARNYPDQDEYILRCKKNEEKKLRCLESGEVSEDDCD